MRSRSVILTEHDMHYMRSIHRRLLDLHAIIQGMDVSIASQVLSDNIDWLDCFIEKVERDE